MILVLHQDHVFLYAIKTIDYSQSFDKMQQFKIVFFATISKEFIYRVIGG